MPDQNKIRTENGNGHARGVWQSARGKLAARTKTSWSATRIFPSPLIRRLFAKEFPDRFFSNAESPKPTWCRSARAWRTRARFRSSPASPCFVMNKGFEQLRVNVAYPKLNVKVVGTHSGISIGEDGPSQMSIEEIGSGLLAARLHGACRRPTRCPPPRWCSPRPNTWARFSCGPAA